LFRNPATACRSQIGFEPQKARNELQQGKLVISHPVKGSSMSDGSDCRWAQITTPNDPQPMKVGKVEVSQSGGPADRYRLVGLGSVTPHHQHMSHLLLTLLPYSCGTRCGHFSAPWQSSSRPRRSLLVVRNQRSGTTPAAAWPLPFSPPSTHRPTPPSTSRSEILRREQKVIEPIALVGRHPLRARLSSNVTLINSPDKVSNVCASIHDRPESRFPMGATGKKILI
jgi:hypothetical protein